MDVFHILIGLVTLLLGAEALVRGASKLASAAGISSLVIGLTVVSFGTSAPELAVSIMAGTGGQAGIALGNVVGSNIFNVLLILGVSAAVRPLAVSSQLVRLDVPVMILASGALAIAALDGRIEGWEGWVFLALATAYTLVLFRLSRRPPLPETTAPAARSGSGAPVPAAEPRPGSPAPAAEPGSGPPARIAVQILLVAAGFAMLVFGSRWLVSGAVGLATDLGVSERVIGLTIVAAGTSVPELATSVVAAFRGEREIAVGNVVGSNIFNILWILGASSVISDGLAVAPALLGFDIPVMVGAAVVCLPIFFTDCRIGRWEGSLFVAFYVAYMIDVIMSATGRAGFDSVRVAIFEFVGPMVVLAIGLSAWASIRRKKRK